MHIGRSPGLGLNLKLSFPNKFGGIKAFVSLTVAGAAVTFNHFPFSSEIGHL